MANNHNDITRMQNQIANFQDMIDEADDDNPAVDSWKQEIENLLSRIEMAEEGLDYD